MATIQLQRTKNVRPITTSAIDQMQSLELVQTTLHASLSTLTWMRELFPDQAYKKQGYKITDRLPSYEDYACGELEAVQRESTASATPMHVLLPHKSKRVDEFLMWLEQTVFTPLKNGTLLAVQVFVHPDSTDQRKVLEEYKFVITYARDGKIAGLALDSPRSSTDIPHSGTQTSNSALQMMVVVSDLQKICEGLPNLPERRFMSIEVLEDGQRNTPVGFVSTTNDGGLCFDEGGGTRMITNSANQLISPFHRVTTKVSNLSQVGPLTSPVHTKSMQVVRVTSPTADTEVSTVFDDSPLDNNISQSTQGHATSDMRQDMQEMNRQEHISQGDTQPQSPAKRQSSKDTSNTTFERANGTPQKSLPTASAYSLTDDKLAELNEQKEILRQVAHDRVANSEPGSKRFKDVTCLCGYYGEEGDMVECDCCGTWQHLHCHGYLSEDDPRLGDYYYCYSCLFAGADLSPPEDLEHLILERRSVFMTFKHGPKSSLELAKLMGASETTADVLFQSLTARGVEPVSVGSKKGGRGRKGTSFVAYLMNCPQDAIEKLFSPLKHVDHYYDPSPLPGDDTVPCLRALQSNEMPPPLTPASKLRKPSSFHTPNQVKSTRSSTRLASQTCKRPAEDGPSGNMSASKRRFTRYRSAIVLDASGNSSPTVQPPF